MNRLIVEIQGKLNEGICGQPYKIVYKHEQHKPLSQQLVPKKFDILQNYGELHLYKDSRLVASLNQDTQLPLVRSTMVLVLGLSQASLDAVMSPLLKQKSDLIEIEILKDKDKRIYLVVVFKFLNQSQQFFSKYQFRLMEDNSHLLCFFLKDVIYLKGAERDSSFDDVLLFGKVESDFKEWIQLPTCMSCLEKIQCKVSGINYNYTGEQELPSRANSNCSLCYMLLNKNSGGIKCSDCQEQKDLWGCLVCGQVGCGRYKQGHAEEHFMNKNHTLSIEVPTQRVWNYLGDSFAHRIIKTGENTLNFPEFECDEYKLQSEQGLLWQYCTKISQELEKQRISYTRRLEELQAKHRNQQKIIKDEIAKMQQMKKTKLKESQVAKARKIRLQIRKKQLRSQISEEKQLNKLLQKQIKSAKCPQNEIITNKKKQLKELQQRIAKMLSQIEFD